MARQHVRLSSAVLAQRLPAHDATVAQVIIIGMAVC